MSEDASKDAGELDLSQLALLLEQLGCPADKAPEMAGQLDRRADQLSESNGKTKTEALRHLILLMQQGWAAKAKGL